LSVKAGIRTECAAYTPEFFDYDTTVISTFRFHISVTYLKVEDMIQGNLGSLLRACNVSCCFETTAMERSATVSEEAGITGWYGGMSSQVGDFDNDGFDEITIGTGNPALDWTEPKPLFHNNGKGQFTDIAQSAGLIHFGMLHGTALADYDDSGNLSLFGSFGGFYWGSRESTKLYRNLGSERLAGSATCRHAFEPGCHGARIPHLQAGAGFTNGSMG